MLRQIGIINKIKDKFNDVIMTTKKPKTPAPPGSIIFRTKEGYPILNYEDEITYQ